MVHCGFSRYTLVNQFFERFSPINCSIFIYVEMGLKKLKFYLVNMIRLFIRELLHCISILIVSVIRSFTAIHFNIFVNFQNDIDNFREFQVKLSVIWFLQVCDMKINALNQWIQHTTSKKHGKVGFPKKKPKLFLESAWVI